MSVALCLFYLQFYNLELVSHASFHAIKVRLNMLFDALSQL